MLRILAFLVPLAAVALAGGGFGRAPDSRASERERMVRVQIEARGIRHPKVLETMRSTLRHLFVPESIRGTAYDDCALPIGYGATISQPYIVALMTELLSPESGSRVLEIGTGSGYQAAVLSPLVKSVYTMEIVPELAASAGATLARLGYANVRVRQGDGYNGWPEQAPFDRIIVTAAPPEVPNVLIEQLAKGGRLVVPTGTGWDQQLMLVEKAMDGSIRQKRVAPVMFVPMRPGKP